jgi:hypothetical protein
LPEEKTLPRLNLQVRFIIEVRANLLNINNMTLQEKLVGYFDITDIDLDYNYSKEVDENGDKIRLDIRQSDKVHYCECPPAKIDEVIEQLTHLKNKGAEHVYIAEHVDHHGYYFYGIKLEDYVATKVSAYRTIKSFPGVNEGEVYVFDTKRNKYYLNDVRNTFVEFRDFAKYPEFFEKIEIEL